MSKIKRSLQAVFLNVSPDAETETWARVGVGVTDMSIAYNPQVKTEQDVTQDTADSEVVGYQPNLPVTQTAKKGDPVYGYINELRRKRATFDDCKTQLLIVDLYDGDKNSGYKAEKQDVTVQIDSYGGAGSDPLSIGYTMNFVGDATTGTFNATTSTFTADDEAAASAVSDEGDEGDEAAAE